MDTEKTLKACRKYKRWNTSELARRSGISRYTIEAIESGKSGARVSTFDILLRTMGFKLAIERKIGGDPERRKNAAITEMKMLIDKISPSEFLENFREDNLVTWCSIMRMQMNEALSEIEGSVK